MKNMECKALSSSTSKILHYITGMLISALCFIACTDLSNKSLNGYTYNLREVEGSENLYLQTVNFSGIIFSANSKIYDNKSRRFTPTIEEIFKAEKILQECLATGKEDSNGILVDKKMIKPLPDYYRQYIGFYNDKGEKVIYFNCFIRRPTIDDNNWQKEELMVKDGGNNYFSILINLQDEGCSLFMVHGVA
ncbi:hypothetical protein ACSBL2_13510 [Pedobacter sp. AW31-3R]|uniref:hypothetical protein n=1 Tax=Pedobacter sp. AW31-3R TaxID=3445781 RepID=UPI003FA16584